MRNLWFPRGWAAYVSPEEFAQLRSGAAGMPRVKVGRDEAFDTQTWLQTRKRAEEEQMLAASASAEGDGADQAKSASEKADTRVLEVSLFAVLLHDTVSMMITMLTETPLFSPPKPHHCLTAYFRPRSASPAHRFFPHAAALRQRKNRRRPRSTARLRPLMCPTP